MSETTERVISSQRSTSSSIKESGSPMKVRATDSGSGPAGDEILHLVQRIFVGQGGAPPQIVAFTSVNPGNGSTEVCVSVARALTKILAGSVCVVEANFRGASLASDLGLPAGKGLREALIRDAPIATYAQRIAQSNLWLLPAGSGSTAPGLLGTEIFRDRVMEMKGQFEVVLIDCSSLNQSADAISIGRWADGLILVLEANETRREDAIEATQILRSADVTILAAVLNNRVSAIPAFLEKRL